MRLWFCSRRVRHLRFVIWFVFSNLIHCGRLVLRMTNTHPRIALEFPMQRSRFGHDCDRNLVCLGALATLSSLEALRLCGCLEAWKLGDAQLGAVGEFSISLPFFGTRRLLLIIWSFRNHWDTWATSCWSGGFPRSKVEQCEAIGISDAPCGCGLLGLRCASRCDAAARGWLWPTGRFHGWFAAGIFMVGWGVSSSFPDLPSQNRIYSIRRWIENRSN